MGATASVPDFFMFCRDTHWVCHIAFLYKSCAFIIRTYLGYSAVPRNILTIKIFSFQMCQTNKMSEVEW